MFDADCFEFGLFPIKSIDINVRRTWGEKADKKYVDSSRSLNELRREERDTGRRRGQC